MRVAVVDDLRTDAETLRGLLSKHLPEAVFIDLYESGEAFLAAEAKHDLVFLDIVMKGMDGIETARRLRMRDMASMIVFLTTSREYVWDAFPVHPFDYLVKPVDEARLTHVLDEARWSAGSACSRSRWAASRWRCRCRRCATRARGITSCFSRSRTGGSSSAT